MSRSWLDPTPHNSTNSHSAESGQAIVLVALTMVAMLGMVGLAIDGGRSLFMYRDAQAATDVAALAAAYAVCSGGESPLDAGYRSAQNNGFVDGLDGKTVLIERAPDWAENEDARTDTNYIGVTITDIAPTYFIQVVYGGPLEITTQAVTHCDPGNTTNTSGGSVVEQYAFRTLSGPGECSAGNPAMTLQGTGYDIYGNIWTGNIDGNVEADNDDPDGTHRIDVFGDIYVGTNENDSANTDTQYVIERTGTFEGEQYGGDGNVSWGAAAPEPAPLPYTMDYFRPNGSSLCTDPGECGTLEDIHGSAYRDISSWCSHGVVNHQDYTNSNFDYWTGSTLQDGIYYSTCPIELNNSVYTGNITLITEEDIDFSGPSYDLTAYGDAPLFVSNRGNGNCTSGHYALQLNANNSEFNGNIIAFEGYITLNANNSIYRSCISAHGVRFLGSEDFQYVCDAPPPAQTTSPPSVSQSE